VIIAPQFRRKAEYTIRKLVFEIGEIHFAYQTVRGSLCRDHGVEFENIDGVLFAADHALVSIRTLDQLFESSDMPVYLPLRDASGGVVRGLTGPRNAAVHFDDIVEPDVKRAIGPVDGYRFIIFPRWKVRAAIPAAAFSGTAQGALKSYDSVVAGRLLHDTLMDALKFFDDCDGSLLPRDGGGQIAGLPLAPLPVGGYFRLHPDWPTHEQAAVITRANARAMPPRGVRRQVVGWLVGDDSQTYICGWTEHDARRASFTEPLDQVVSDIGMGYTYDAEVDGSTLAVSVDSGDLVIGTKGLGDSGLPDLKSVDSWSVWADLVATDAGYYQAQRTS
jgi:hypothetical protein